MKMKYLSKITKKWIPLLVIAALVCSAFCVDTMAADANPADLTACVKKSVGTKYPFYSSHAKTSTRFVCGVKPGNFESYAWYEKESGSGSKKVKYILVIAKAKKRSYAKSAKNDFKEYIKEEGSTMNSYLSAEGKKAFKAAQVGYKGCYAWAVMVNSSSSVNKNAVKALKKKL